MKRDDRVYKTEVPKCGDATLSAGSWIVHVHLFLALTKPWSTFRIRKIVDSFLAGCFVCFMFRGCEIKLKNETILGLIVLYLLWHKYLGLFMETNSNSWVLFMGWVELSVLWMGYTLWKILPLYRLWLQMLLLENCMMFFLFVFFLIAPFLDEIDPVHTGLCSSQDSLLTHHWR